MGPVLGVIIAIGVIAIPILIVALAGRTKKELNNKKQVYQLILCPVCRNPVSMDADVCACCGNGMYKAELRKKHKHTEILIVVLLLLSIAGMALFGFGSYKAYERANDLEHMNEGDYALYMAQKAAESGITDAMFGKESLLAEIDSNRTKSTVYVVLAVTCLAVFIFAVFFRAISEKVFRSRYHKYLKKLKDENAIIESPNAAMYVQQSQSNRQQPQQYQPYQQPQQYQSYQQPQQYQSYQQPQPSQQPYQMVQSQSESNTQELKGGS